MRTQVLPDFGYPATRMRFPSTHDPATTCAIGRESRAMVNRAAAACHLCLTVGPDPAETQCAQEGKAMQAEAAARSERADVAAVIAALGAADHARASELARAALDRGELNPLF